MGGGLARGRHRHGLLVRQPPTRSAKVAVRYYSGGRTMSTQDAEGCLRRRGAGGARAAGPLQPQIEQQARTIDVNRIVQMVRGT